MHLTFSSSERSTIGVEWELQLIDKDSNDLRQAANAILDAPEAQVDGKLHPHIQREMLLNTIEITSGARHTVGECMRDITETIELLRPVTDRLRIELGSAGTHPFASPAFQRVTDSERYAELVERTQYWGRQMLLYGIHVHVGVESRDKVLPLQSALASRLGHMQSLAASSPFWSGRDTGYASNRAMVFQQLPTAGIPQQFEQWGQLEKYVADMIRTGIIDGFDEVRWDVRPSPKLGTVENRVFDAATNATEVAALAALTHCLVEWYSRKLDAGEQIEPLPEWFVAENKWRSARYGMEAILILDAHGNEELVTDTVVRMLNDLEPVAKDLKCADELASIEKILKLGASYQRQRIVAENARHNSREAVTELLLAEMRAGRPLNPLEFLNTRSKGAPSTDRDSKK